LKKLKKGGGKMKRELYEQNLKSLINLNELNNNTAESYMYMIV